MLSFFLYDACFCIINVIEKGIVLYTLVRWMDGLDKSGMYKGGITLDSLVPCLDGCLWNQHSNNLDNCEGLHG